MASIPSPLTGRVISVPVKAGDSIAAGDALVIIESMKMEIPIEAEAAGSIARVLVGEGDEVSEGQALVELG